MSFSAVAVHHAAADLLIADHDRASRDIAGHRIADLLGLPFVGSDYQPGAYVIPSDTLSLRDAHALGLTSETAFFGGAVPYPFVGTKAISHGLPFADAARPDGWNPDLGRALAPYVLEGFTAFDLEEALAAGRRLLQSGPVRVKDVRANAGAGQTVAGSDTALVEALRSRDIAEISEHGVVIEENLDDPETLSVGTARIGPYEIAYWGRQRFIDLADGRTVYGGSDLLVAQGGIDDLLGFDLPANARQAIDLARAYDAACFAAYPDLLVSRRNYDVILGPDALGRRRAGVLEQSWRIGGASGAEIAAMEDFRRDPTPRLVAAQTVEIRSAAMTVPENAVLYYQGVDPSAGPITKYARVLP